MISIREATVDDFKDINVVSSYLGYGEIKDDEAKAKLLHITESPTDFVYVAESDQKIVGWIHLFFPTDLHRLILWKSAV